MLVHEPTRRVVLNLSAPQRVLSVLPTAKPLSLNGKSLVAVPHRLEETRVLRNIGFDVPGPIRHYYKWPGLYTPGSHQIDTADFLTLNPRSFCLNDMGTGKTLSVLWAYDYLRSSLDCGSLLVVAPLSTLERTWADEVFKHFPGLTVSVLHGTMDRRLKLLEYGADVLVINHDGIKSERMHKALVERVKSGQIGVVAVDELAEFRNQRTDRWSVMNSVAKHAPYAWGITGTPMPQEPTDAYAQIKMIQPKRVTSYMAFRDATMDKVGMFKWTPKKSAVDFVHNAMQPSIYFPRDGCIDLPPTTYQTRRVELTQDQKKLYEDLTRKMRVMLEEGAITAVNEAALRTKLLQVVCGVVYGDDGDISVPAVNRVEVLKEVVAQAGSKAIVFVPFRGVIEYVAKELSANTSVAVIHGQVKKETRDSIFADFQKRPDPRVIVAQPGTMSHGLTLTAANVIVWFSPIDAAGVYQQACARILRSGQQLPTTIVNIEGCPLERKMYDRLQRRESMQGALLSLFDA